MREVFKVEEEFLVLGKTFDSTGEFVDVYGCPFCDSFRSIMKERTIKHMKQCYNEQEGEYL